MKVKNIISALLLLISCLAISCKKDKNRINNPTYQLDSVIVSSIDTLGNETIDFRIPTTSNNIQIFTDIYNFGIPQLVYRYHADSIVTELHTESCTNSPNTELLNYSVVVDGRYTYAYHENYYGCYGQDGRIYNRFNVSYDATNRLSKTNSKFDYIIGGGAYQEFEVTSNINYSGNNFSSISINYKEYTNDRTDSLFYSVINPVSYTNRYLNQKDLIGFDLNNLTLHHFIVNFYNIYYNLPLIINKQLSFNAPCDYLIEHINFPQVPVVNLFNQQGAPVNRHDRAVDFLVDYTFDAAHSNRVQTMTFHTTTIENSTKYTFVYND